MKTITGPLAALKLNQIVAYDATLDDAAKRIFSVLAGYVDKDGFCWPSVSKIANSFGVSRSAVTKQINILIEHDYVSRVSRYTENGRRKSNLYQLNYAIAKELYKKPECFCKRDVTLLVASIVTLSSCSGMQLSEVMGIVTGLGDTNITSSKEQLENNKEKPRAMVSPVVERQKIRVTAWESEKARESETGLTPHHKKKIEALMTELRQHWNAFKIVQYDCETRAACKERGLSPLEATEYQIWRLEEAVQECKSGALAGK